MIAAAEIPNQPASQLPTSLALPYYPVSALPIFIDGFTTAIRFIFDDCCARAVNGSATVPLTNVMNSRRLIPAP
jgi:hypothetical protein